MAHVAGYNEIRLGRRGVIRGAVIGAVVGTLIQYKAAAALITQIPAVGAAIEGVLTAVGGFLGIPATLIGLFIVLGGIAALTKYVYAGTGPRLPILGTLTKLGATLLGLGLFFGGMFFLSPPLQIAAYAAAAAAASHWHGSERGKHLDRKASRPAPATDFGPVGEPAYA